MKKTTIKAINKYVKKVSMSVCEYDKNLSDIQEEMKAHIIDKTNELIDQNLKEEEALEKALLDFGDSNSISKEFGPFTPKFKFNNLLKASLFGYIFSTLLLVITFIFIRFYNEDFIAIHHLHIKSIGNCSILLINIFSLSFIIWQIINCVQSKSIIILKKSLLI
ncbi:MAG: hypothetical protein GX275_00460, partial [Clostridiales bacterium]|nr:hypothetical protein [Clostridiales bacterium]